MAKVSELPDVSPATVAALRQITGVDVLEAGQAAGMLGFATKADMDASLAHAAGTLALVTNDPTPANNGTYRKTGASGAGGWAVSADRVTGLEGRVSAAEGADGFLSPSSESDINFDFAGGMILRISGNVRFFYDRASRLLVAQSIAIPASGNHRIIANIATGALSFSAGATVPVGSAVVGEYSAPRRMIKGLDRYQVNGQTAIKPAFGMTMTSSLTSGITFHTDTRRLVIPGALVRVVTPEWSNKVLPATDIDFPANGSYRIEYDPAADVVAFYASSAAIDTSRVIIGQVRINTGSVDVHGVAKYFVTPPAADNNAPRSGRLISEPQYINFDWVGGFLRITAANRVRVHYGMVNAFVAMQDMAFPTSSVNNWFRLLYAPETSALSWLAVSNAALPATAVTVAYFHPVRKEVIGVHDYYTNGQPVAGNGQKAVDQIEWLPVMGDARPDFEVATPLPNFKALGTTADHTEFYALYDALVASHPDYASRTLLGEDDDGNNIYRYDFAPPAVPTAGRHAKMILMSGVHGFERAGIFCLYSAIKHVCESWQSNPLLDTLRWNCHFIVVPIAVPYGFDNMQRKNENGVDVARNFPADWASASNDPGSNQYRGPSPLSEKSTQYLDAIMSANRDAIYCGSFHHFGDPGANNDFIWNSSMTTFGVRLAQGLISTLTRRWKTRFAWLPQNNIWYAGYANLTAPPGSEGRQSTLAYGIQGGTFEVSGTLPLAPDSDAYSSEVATLGTETVVNWLLMNLDHGTQLYNGRGS